MVLLNRLGLQVPAGFVVTTESCMEFFHARNELGEDLIQEYTRNMHELERKTGHLFGEADDKTFPLFVSIRASEVDHLPG